MRSRAFPQQEQPSTADAAGGRIIAPDRPAP